MPKAKHDSHAAVVLGEGFPFIVAQAITTKPAGSSRIDAAAGRDVIVTAAASSRFRQYENTALT